MEMGQGLGWLKEQQEKFGSSRNRGSGFKKLWLKDGDTALVHFITDANDVRIPLIHGVPKVGKNGPWMADVLCAKSSLDEECPLGDRCLAIPVNEEGKRINGGPWLRTVFYVYVDKIWHNRKDPNGAWVARASGEGTVYEENVEDVWLLIPKFKLEDQIRAAVLGDPTEDNFESHLPTLKDRSFRIRVSGERQQRQEILLAGKVYETGRQPDKVLEKAESLPDLQDTITAEFGDPSLRVIPLATRTATPQSDDYSIADYASDDAELEEVSF